MISKYSKEEKFKLRSYYLYFKNQISCDIRRFIIDIKKDS
jgi:hypothetical protein